MKTNIKRNEFGKIDWRESTFTPEDYIANMREFGHALYFCYLAAVDFNTTQCDPDGIIRHAIIESFLAHPTGYLTKAGKQRVHSAVSTAQNAIAIAACEPIRASASSYERLLGSKQNKDEADNTMKSNILRNQFGKIDWSISTFTPEDYIVNMREFGHALYFSCAAAVDFNSSQCDPDGIIRQAIIESFLAHPTGYLTKAGKQRVHSAASTAQHAIAIAASDQVASNANVKKWGKVERPRPW